MRRRPNRSSQCEPIVVMATALAVGGCGVGRDEVGVFNPFDDPSTSGHAGDDHDPADDGPAPSSSEGSTDDGDTDGPKLDVAPPGTGNGECICAPGLDLVYLLGTAEELWTFDPVTQDFELVGSIDCEAQHDFSGDSFSMGIGRDGRAWVEYDNGDLYTVDVADPSVCHDPGFVPGQLGIGTFGMSFVSNSETDPCDRLYGRAANILSNRKLAVMDTDDLVFEEIAVTDYEWVELSGTGDGQLFEFVNGDLMSAPLLIRLDRDTGETLELVELQGVPPGGDFAFAFWGGDFYLFSGDAFGTSVSHVDWDESDGPGRAVTVIIEEAPVVVIGAGTSTCVPIGPVG